MTPPAEGVDLGVSAMWITFQTDRRHGTGESLSSSNLTMGSFVLSMVFGRSVSKCRYLVIGPKSLFILAQREELSA